MGSRDGTRAWCDTGQPRQRFQKYRWLADRCPRVALKHGFARHTSEETTTRSFESGSPDASAFVGSDLVRRRAWQLVGTLMRSRKFVAVLVNHVRLNSRYEPPHQLNSWRPPSSKPAIKVNPRPPNNATSACPFRLFVQPFNIDGRGINSLLMERAPKYAWFGI